MPTRLRMGATAKQGIYGIRAKVAHELRRAGLRAKRPAITVVVPAYNVEEYLAECLESLLTQSFDDFEIVLVNDGSNDNTRSIAGSFAMRDRRLRIIDQSNAGLSAARNAGVRQARGRYIFFVDSDDIIPKRALTALFSTANKTGSDIVVGSYQRFTSRRSRVPAWIKEAHAQEQLKITAQEFPELIVNIVAVSKLYRRSFLIDNNLRFVPGVLYEDQEFAARVYTTAKSIDVVTDVVYGYREREDGSSITQRRAELSNASALFDALDAALRVYKQSGSVQLLEKRLAHMLRVDLPGLAVIAAVSSPEHRDETRRRTASIMTAASDEIWLLTPVVSRIRVYCASHELWDELLAFDESIRVGGQPLPAGLLDEGLSLISESLPPGIAALPATTLQLSAMDASLVVCLSDVTWIAPNALQIQGWAFIRGLTTDPAETKVQAFAVCKKSGQRIELDTQTFNDGAPTEWSQHRQATYDDGNFSVRIDTNALLASDAERVWTLEFEYQQLGHLQTSPVTHRYRGGTVGRLYAMRVSHRDRTGYLVPKFSQTAGLSLTFRQGKVLASNLEVATDGYGVSASLTSLQSGFVVNSVVAINRVTKQESTGQVHRSADNSYALTLSLPHRNIRPGTAGWELLAEDASGKRLLLDWFDQTDVAPTEGLAWLRTPNGYAALEIAPKAVTVTAIQFESTQIAIRVNAAGTDADELLQCSLRAGSMDIPPISSIALGSDQVELRFPTSGTVLGTTTSTLQAGNYHLRFHGNDESPRPIIATVGDESAAAIHTRWYGASFNAQAWRVPENRELRLTISAPLARDERGARNQWLLAKWYRDAEFVPEDSVLLQCYRGEIAADSQLALHHGIRESGSRVPIYWGVSDLSVEVPRDAIPLVIGSRQWYRVLGSAKFLSSNIDFDRFFRRRNYQFVLATFHGYPFKAMGRSAWLSSGRSEYQVRIELERRKREWSCLVVPSETAAALYRAEYEYDGDIMVTGYPRDDALVLANRTKVRTETLRRLDIDPARKVVLFAPTWRETMAVDAWSAHLFNMLDLAELATALGPEYAILVRGHNFNARTPSRLRGTSVFDVTDYPDVNDLILSADAAILDYSSLRFDWALTGRPSVYFVPDKAEYFRARPPLFDFEPTAPGPQFSTTAQVIEALRDIEQLQREWQTEIDVFNRRFNQLHDGHATERVLSASVAPGRAPWLRPQTATK